MNFARMLDELASFLDGKGYRFGVVGALALHAYPSRTFQELAEIQFILGLPGIDEELIRAQFERHGLLGRFDDIKKTLGGSRP